MIPTLVDHMVITDEPYQSYLHTNYLLTNLSTQMT